MKTTQKVYYLSGSTGILAKDMGKAILSQFPEVEFCEELIPFIRSESAARKAKERILCDAAGSRPLVLSTLLSKEFNDIFNVPEIYYTNIYDALLAKIETFLETKALWIAGASRNPDNTTMVRRVEAIHYCVDHDDGTGTNDYDKAEIILLGVSRSGKTPVSVYLATQLGIKTANYPLVKDDLDAFRLPNTLIKNIKKVVGLSTSPKLLHKYREHRFAGSSYSSFETCSEEIQKASRLCMHYQIPIIIGDGKSIEEMAIQVMQELDFPYSNSEIK